nr:cupin-like domain-containing protein [Pseudomonas syringae]
MDTQSTAPSNKVINFAEKFSLFTEQWTPKVISAMNDYQFKLVKVEGEFIWHSHADTDEVFIVLEGELEIYLRDVKVTLNSGEMYVVKKGVEHKLRFAGSENYADRAQGRYQYRRSHERPDSRKRSVDLSG